MKTLTSTAALSSITQRIKSNLSSFLRDTRGLSTVEYIILMVIVVVGGAGIWGEIGEDLVAKLTTSKDAIQGIEQPGQ